MSVRNSRSIFAEQIEQIQRDVYSLYTRWCAGDELSDEDEKRVVSTSHQLLSLAGLRFVIHISKKKRKNGRKKK